MEFILASHNQKKLDELRQILDGFHVQVIPLPAGAPEPEENGSTFAANAQIKAHAAAAFTGKAAIADDSGLCVDALGGAPGIYSARYADGTDQGNNQKLLCEMEAIPDGHRQARFICAVACVLPDGREFTVQGECEGEILRQLHAAAQMILAPGAHMIWMFSEMGNDQNTKDATGGNNTDPKIVNWDALQQPEYKGLVNNYRELIGVRLANTDLFAADANYTSAVTTSNWKNGRSIFSTTADKELYAVINPNVSEAITMTVNFRNDNNNAYKIVSKSFESNPSFDAAAKTVTVEPNCYVVLASDNVTGIHEVAISGSDNADNVAIYAMEGAITVANCDTNVNIFTLDGATVASAKGNGTFNVNPGLYIVKAGKTTAKVLVK